MPEEKAIVENFAKKMVEKLEKRQDRYAVHSWRSLDLKRLLWLMEGEIMELKDAKNKDEGNALQQAVEQQIQKSLIKDNCIDIANYAMFIHENTK